MEFKYEALDAQGREVKDTIEALDNKEAVSKIRNLGLFPTKVRFDSPVEFFKKDKRRYRIPRWLIAETNKEKIMFSIICLLIVLVTGLVMQIINS